MNRKLYPLKFNPAFLEKIWGNESWLISSMGDGLEGEVEEGYLAGNTLSELIETYMGELVGDDIFDCHNLQFPVLVKRLEVDGRISIQVHPDDDTALERYYDYGKEECWYVIDADESARVYIGFKQDTDAGELYLKCKDGSVTDMLNVFTPKPGDFFRIQAGTVHACSGKLTIAEIQEPSDTTLRLYDWGNENAPETARKMHLEEAMDIIDYSAYDTAANCKNDSDGNAVLSQSEHFTIESIHLDKALKMDGVDNSVVYVCVAGAAIVNDTLTGIGYNLAEGEAILIPATLDSYTLSPGKPGTVLLKVHTEIQEERDSYIEGDEHEN